MLYKVFIFRVRGNDAEILVDFMLNIGGYV